MALATTCPQCKTSFKVVPDQLKLRRGLVRCGVCQHVFSGIDYLRYVDDATGVAHRPGRTAPTAVPAADAVPAASPTAAPPQPVAAPSAARVPVSPEPSAAAITVNARPDAGAPWPDTAAQGPHTVIDPDNLKTAFFLTDSLIGPLAPEGMPPRPAVASRPALEPDPLAIPPADARPRRRSRQAAPGDTPASAPTAKPEIAFDLLADTPAPRGLWRVQWHRPSPRTWAVVAALVALLGLQALVGWRDNLAARAPALAPLLAGLLEPFGLRVSAPRDLTAMTIESFELQTADTPNVLTMQAVLRNHAAHPVGFPAMELTLTDTSGRLLVRKVIPVEVYLQNDPQGPAGLAGGAERPLKLAMEHDGLQPAGFSVALFYP